MSMTNRQHDQILTPTMVTIHSKDPSDDSRSGLALNDQITGTLDDRHFDRQDDRLESRTISTFNPNVRSKGKRRSMKGMVSWQPNTDPLDDDDEEKLMGDISSVMTETKRRRRRQKRGKSWKEELILPTSTDMAENVKLCFERRDRLVIESDDSLSSSSEEQVQNLIAANTQNGTVQPRDDHSSTPIDELEMEDVREYMETMNNKHVEMGRR